MVASAGSNTDDRALAYNDRHWRVELPEVPEPEF